MSNQSIYWVVAEVNPKIAGYRVRVAPLAAALEQYSITPVIIPMSEFEASVEKIATQASVVIVAKPSDTATFLCMKYLLSQGVRILVDLFDNYFSWSSPLYQQAIPWQWLRAIEVSSGVCASTPYIAETLRKLGVQEVCLVSDALPWEGSIGSGGSGLHPKWHNPKQIELMWFGLNGNPYYHVGVDDLISWTRVVSFIRDRLRGQRRIRLTICTNRVPAVEAAMTYFRSEGIDTQFVEWTEEACDELLRASHLVLIPSNLSGFSLSKTHNRCSDAILRQCLVLSSPDGPYHEFPGAVYRDVEVLCRDLVTIDPARIAAGIDESLTYLTRTYTLSENASRLAAFIRKRKPDRKVSLGTSSPPPVLVAGWRTRAQTVKLSRRLGYLTACFDGSGNNLNFDFLLVSRDTTNARVTFQISKAAKEALEGIHKGVHSTAWLEDDDFRNTRFEVQEIEDGVLLTLTLPTLQPLLDEVEAIRAIVDTHSHLRERMFDIHVEIIVTALRRLGFGNLDYCTENAGGWESYAIHGNPKLAKAACNLHQIWLKYQGNERGIGQPLRPRGALFCQQ